MKLKFKFLCYICHQMYMRIVAILLLGIYSVSSPIGEQLMKLPVFVIHYYEHQQLEPQITLGEFFKIHYLAEQHLGGDYDRDMQLPFKTTNQSIVNNIFFFSIDICVFDFVPKHNYLSEKHPLVQVQLEGLLALNSIWQPPRFIS